MDAEKYELIDVLVMDLEKKDKAKVGYDFAQLILQMLGYIDTEVRVDGNITSALVWTTDKWLPEDADKEIKETVLKATRSILKGIVEIDSMMKLITDYDNGYIESLLKDVIDKEKAEEIAREESK